MYWYWWAWLAIVVFLIVLPLSYGMGYRRWGPPYPRYYVRLRGGVPRGAHPDPDAATRTGAGAGGEPERQVVLVEELPPEEPSGWGILADLLWLAVLGAIIWAIVAAIP